MQLVAGRITKPHGVRGEVAVDVRTDDPDRRFAVGAVLDTDPAAAGPLTVASVRSHQGRLLIRFEGFEDRTSVEPLAGTHLMVEPDPARHPDEFYPHELVGLRVFDPAGEPLGSLREVLQNPGNDLLDIERLDGRSALVPFVAAIVTEIDLEAGTVVVDAPAGLFDDVAD